MNVGDSIQQQLLDYALTLRYADLPAEVVHAAKARIVDTLGTTIGGFFGEPSVIARNVAAHMPDPNGATLFGTRIKTTPDMAAFANGTAAGFPSMADSYHKPGADQGHACETIMPLLAAAEHVKASGHDFVAAVVLGYEVFLRFSDIFHNEGFDNSIFGTIATALAAGKLWGLKPEQLAHAISMAAVPNNMLRQTKKNTQTMFKAVAAGQAGRAGLFAAQLARAGMEGPHLPFEGKAGWCDHIARERFSLEPLDRDGPFKILHTLIKTRPGDGKAIASILAAEKLAPLGNIESVNRVVVETYKKARDNAGSGDRCLNPQSREDAIYSIFYLVAATLIDGTVTLRSFNDTHLSNPRLRALMQKVEIVENEAFTRAFEGTPQVQRGRITITMRDGQQLVAESGGDQDDMSFPKSDVQIEQKFRGLTEELFGAHRVNSLLKDLWHIEDFANTATIPSAFVFD